MTVVVVSVDEKLLQMARESGLHIDEGWVWAGNGRNPAIEWPMIERFAKLVAELEREECAKVCNAQYSLRGTNDDHKYMADKCAMDIRARGKQEKV